MYIKLFCLTLCDNVFQDGIAREKLCGQNRKTSSSGEEEEVLQTLWERFHICPNGGVHKEIRVIRIHPDLCQINTQLLGCLTGLVGKPIRRKGDKVPEDE